MGNMMIRNLPDEVHDHLREQASSNRRSLEAEVRPFWSTPTSLATRAVLGRSFGLGSKARVRSVTTCHDHPEHERSVRVQRPAPHPNVLAWLDAREPGNLYVTAITAEELFFGAFILPAGDRKTRLVGTIEAMLQDDFAGRILPYDGAASLF